MEPPVRKDEDRAWKHILEVRFRQFLSFYFPSLARKIDWRTRPVFLEQELQHIVPRSQGKRHVVDALARRKPFRFPGLGRTISEFPCSK